MDNQAFTLLSKSIDRLHDSVNGLRNGVEELKIEIVEIKKNFIPKPNIRTIIAIISLPSVIASAIAVCLRFI